MAEELGLKEAFFDKYGENEAPNTFFRGSTTLDGMFISNELHIVQGGYINTEDSPGDHCAQWADFMDNDIVGETMEERARPLDRKATSKIPSVRDKFNLLINEELTRHNMKDKTKQCYDACIQSIKDHNKITEEQKATIETLFDRTKRAMRFADKRCRKGRRGGIPFSKNKNT